MELLRAGINRPGELIQHRGGGSGLLFDLPLLTHLEPRISADPTITEPGAGSIRMVEDHEQVLRRVNSGELRFKGARRAENLIPTKDLSNAAWAKNGSVAATFDAATGVSSVTGFTTGTGAAISDTYDGGISKNGQQHRVSLKIKSIDDVGDSIRVRIRDGSGGSTTQNLDVVLTANWVRYAIPVHTGVSDSEGIAVEFHVGIGSGTLADTFQVKELMLEEVSGASNLAPSEYLDETVDYGVGNAVLGVKNYTTVNGNSVASNVVTESTGAAIAADTLKGYFAEPTIDNKVDDPINLDNATGGWTELNITVTPGVSAAPDGRVTANTLNDAAAGALGNTKTTTFTISGAQTYTGSVYIKQDAVDKLTRHPALEIVWTGGTASTVMLGMATDDGEIASTVVSGSATIDATHVETITLPNGDVWYRLVMTSTSDGTNTGVRLRVSPAFGTNTNLITANNAAQGTITAWGAQLENSTNVSTLFPANGTRAPDENLKYHIDNVPLTVYSAEAEITYPYSDANAADTTMDFVRGGDVDSRIFYQTSGSNVRMSNIANGSANTINNGVLTIAAGDTVRARGAMDGALGADQLRISVKDTADTVATDTTPADDNTTNVLGANLEMLRNIETNNDGSVGIGWSIKNVKIWNTDKGDTWLNEV